MLTNIIRKKLNNSILSFIFKKKIDLKITLYYKLY